MPRVLIIDKTGEIQTLNIKSFVEEDLYKKCNFKSSEGFGLQTIWNISPDTNISVYGKTIGRANFENKYEFPPPIDKVLFFGSCVLVRKDTSNTVLDLTTDNWERIYNKLMGGFEDLNENEEESEDESEDEKLPRTKSGYVKDDFVVDDDDCEEDEDYEEDEPRPKKATKKTPKKAAVKVPRKTAQQISEEVAAAESKLESSKKNRKKKSCSATPSEPTQSVLLNTEEQEKNIYDEEDELFEEPYEE